MSDAQHIMDRFVVRHGAAPRRQQDALLDAAFGLQRRTKTSYRLREGSRPVPGLSLHAVDAVSGRLAGVVSFWPVRGHPGGGRALLLGPLAVHPDFQNGGLGAELMRAGLQAAADAGHRLVLLVGDAPYYGRHGFVQVPAGHIVLPGPFDPARLLYRELQPGALHSVSGLLLPEWRYQRLAAGRRQA